MAPIPFPHPALDPTQPVPTQLTSVRVYGIIAWAAIIAILLLLAVGIIGIKLPSRIVYRACTRLYSRCANNWNEWQNKTNVRDSNIPTQPYVPHGYSEYRYEAHFAGSYELPWPYISLPPAYAEEEDVAINMQDACQLNAGDNTQNYPGIPEYSIGSSSSRKRGGRTDLVVPHEPLGQTSGAMLLPPPTMGHEQSPAPGYIQHSAPYLDKLGFDGTLNPSMMLNGRMRRQSIAPRPR